MCRFVHSTNIPECLARPDRCMWPGGGEGVQLCVWQTGPLPLGEEIDKRREHGHSILEVEERKRGLEIRWSGK